MTTEEIISSLEDQVKDRESSIDETDPDCIFRKDAEALREAVKLLRRADKGVEIDPVKTVKLDRSRWDGCEWCRDIVPHLRNSTMMFCIDCGRPLTEGAWAELESRIGGDDETADMLEPRV